MGASNLLAAMTSFTPAPQRSAPRRRRRLAAVAVVVLAWPALGACGDDEPTASPAAAPAGSGTSVAPTPTTPAGPGNVVADCGEGAGPCPPGAPATVPTTATTSGIVEVDDGAPAEVVASSVRVAETSRWWAIGLVRDEGGEGVRSVTVVADLLDPGGAVLDSVRADALVAPVLPGEEVPFELSSEVAASDVARVRWRAQGTDGAAESGVERPLDVATFWVRPFGEARPVEVPGYADVVGGPYPYVLYGGVTARAAPVALPGAVAAWQGPDGRLLAVATAPALEAGTDRPASSLAPGAALDVVLVVDDPVAGPQLADATPILWGVSR